MENIRKLGEKSQIPMVMDMTPCRLIHKVEQEFLTILKREVVSSSKVLASARYVYLHFFPFQSICVKTELAITRGEQVILSWTVIQIEQVGHQRKSERGSKEKTEPLVAKSSIFTKPHRLTAVVQSDRDLTTAVCWNSLLTARSTTGTRVLE
jgi:hypothetical protein